MLDTQDFAGRIAQHLMRWSNALLRFDRVAIYMALPGELSCARIAHDVMSHGGRVFAPKMRAGVCDIDMIELRRWDNLQSGKWGVLEPRGEVVPASHPDLILVPGLMFDTRGGRLGFGKGYYDRYLARARAMGRAPLVLGVCDEVLLSPVRVPMGARDERMDGVLTQERLICWNQRGYGASGGGVVFENHSPRLDIQGNEADKRGAQRSRAPELMEEADSDMGCSRLRGLLDT